MAGRGAGRKGVNAGDNFGKEQGVQGVSAHLQWHELVQPVPPAPGCMVQQLPASQLGRNEGHKRKLELFISWAS